jgi:hypothetical protein
MRLRSKRGDPEPPFGTLWQTPQVITGIAQNGEFWRAGGDGRGCLL